MKLVFGISDALTLQDPYADASIGNITGSNSVNVCLVAERSSEFDGHGWKKLQLNCVGLKYPSGTKRIHSTCPLWNEEAYLWYKYIVGRSRFLLGRCRHV